MIVQLWIIKYDVKDTWKMNEHDLKQNTMVSFL